MTDMEAFDYDTWLQDSGRDPEDERDTPRRRISAGRCMLTGYPDDSTTQLCAGCGKPFDAAEDAGDELFWCCSDQCAADNRAELDATEVTITRGKGWVCESW